MKLFGSFTLLVVVAAALISESTARVSGDAVELQANAGVSANANKGQAAAGAHVAAKGQVSHKKLVKHKKKKAPVKVVKHHGKGFVPRKNLTPAQIAKKNQVKSLLLKVPTMKVSKKVRKTIKKHKKPSVKKPTKKPSKPTKKPTSKPKPTSTKKSTKKTSTKKTSTKKGTKTKTTKAAAQPTTPAVVADPSEEEPVELTEQEQLDYMCYTTLKAERPAMQYVEEIGDALSTITQDYTYTHTAYETLTVTAGARVTPRAVLEQRQLNDEAIAILTNPDATPEQIKAVTDGISKSYNQDKDIVSQACFELVYNGEYEVTYNTITPAVETEFKTVATTTQYLATVTVAARA